MFASRSGSSVIAASCASLARFACLAIERSHTSTTPTEDGLQLRLGRAVVGGACGTGLAHLVEVDRGAFFASSPRAAATLLAFSPSRVLWFFAPLGRPRGMVRSSGLPPDGVVQRHDDSHLVSLVISPRPWKKGWLYRKLSQADSLEPIGAYAAGHPPSLMPRRLPLSRQLLSPICAAVISAATSSRLARHPN
jgi:hypothetical protein